LDQIMEKLMSERKVLVGYDRDEVKEKFQTLKTDFLEKKHWLLQQIETIQAENRELKEKINLLQHSPLEKQLKDEVSSMIMAALLEDTQEINQLIEELDRLEKPFHEMVKIKKQQKEQAKRRVAEAANFLKSFHTSN
jgi:hypothetical protein